MMMNFDEHKPIYLQISDSICEKILNDEYAEDENAFPPSGRWAHNSVNQYRDALLRLPEIARHHLRQAGRGVFASPDARVKSMYKKEFMETELPVIVKKINMLED